MARKRERQREIEKKKKKKKKDNVTDTRHVPVGISASCKWRQDREMRRTRADGTRLPVWAG